MTNAPKILYINVPFACYGEQDLSYRVVCLLYGVVYLCERGEEPVRGELVDVHEIQIGVDGGEVLKKRRLRFTVCVAC